MIGIRQKIQNALIGSVLILSFCSGMILTFNQRSLLQSQKIIDTMTMEYSLISLTNELVVTYNDIVKNPGNTEFTSKYQLLKSQINTAISTLKDRIALDDSRVLLLGIENTIQTIISECDDGIKQVENNNFSEISGHFALALKHNEFVASNTATLLQKELEYLSTTQAKSKYYNLVGIYTSGIILILITLSMIFYAHSFSKQLITPIEHLTRSTQAVAGGNMEESIDSTLLSRTDEVGTLTQSFNQMVKTIKDKIAKLASSNEELNKLKTELESGNAKLTKLNEFMVGRELKMVELKKQIADLTSPK